MSFTASFLFPPEVVNFPPEETKKSCQVVPEQLSWQDCYNVLFYADFINEEECRLTLS